jgi:hypothetical protein
LQFLHFTGTRFFPRAIPIQLNRGRSPLHSSERKYLVIFLFAADRKSVREWRQVGRCENSNDDGRINNMNSPVT